MLTAEVVDTGRTAGEVRPSRNKTGWNHDAGNHKAGRDGVHAARAAVIARRRLPVRPEFAYYAVNHGRMGRSNGKCRLKLYMPAGLSVGQIVLVSGFTAWTFCLGAALVAGVSMFGEADRIARLVGGPPLAAHAVGAGLLIVLAGYLVLGMRDRFVEWRGRRLSTPGPILTPLQIIVPAIDVALAGLALYVLLPPLPIGPVGFVGLYVVATSIGLASHVPGGLGVFEGAMVLMLPELPLEPLIAAMLAYRLIYYLGPLALATLLFAATAVRDQRR